MNWVYDESLSQNPFFLHIQKHHGDIIKKAAKDNWLICIPRLGTLDPNTITSEDVFEHVLVPTTELPCSRFNSLNKQHESVVEDKCIICANKKHIRILFEETFYIDKSTKYTLFCIERPLSRKALTPDYNYCWLNLQECVRLLQDKHPNLLEYIRKYIQNVESQLDTNNLSTLKTLILVWYKDIFKMCDPKIKLAVESYIQHCTYNKLFSAICNYTAECDANINKIIRNITDIQLKDLELHEYIEGMSVAKFEFSSINNYTTILDKVSSLKRAVKAFSSKTSKLLITTDVTLKIFVFLIIKSNINNWVANLTYISQFKSDIDLYDEHSFFVTTLEAAIEYIKSGELTQTYDVSGTQLFKFIKTGNLGEVRKYLKSEPLIDIKCHPLCNCYKCSSSIPFNINSCDDKGLTALHIACFYGHPHIVEFLIGQNVLVDVFDYSEMMPIHYTSLKGHQNALLLLLHAGALINPKNSGGNTPLHLASNNGHENCIKALVYFAEQQGAFIEINCTNNFGDTPLHLASKWGYCGIVNILIQYGADRSVKNKRFQTALDVAQNTLLKNTMLINTEDYKNKTVPFTSKSSRKSHVKNKQIDLLLKSIENKDTPLMCYYLGIPMPQIASNSNIASSLNCHPLCTCENCSTKQLASGEKSVNQKPLNINTTNIDGFSALHVAALYGHTDILRILLDSGACVNVQTKNLCTPLHLACVNQWNTAVCELLKCGGCEIDVQDYQGNTPLHYACINNNARIAEILLSNTSNINIKNNAGKTALQIATDQAYFNIVRLLSNKSDLYEKNDDSFS